MIYVQSIWRSLAWLAIGVFFGLVSIMFILASSVLFDKSMNTSDLFDCNVIVFLCIALMSGAAADFLLTGNYHVGWRATAFAFTIVASLFAWVLFGPNNKVPPSVNVKDAVSETYGLATLIYCVGLKALLIYRERLNHEKAKFHTAVKHN